MYFILLLSEGFLLAMAEFFLA